MKFLLAPDSFKECMTAKEAALTMQQAVLRVFPDAGTVLLPVADGGEGTLDVLVETTHGRVYETEVTGPLGGSVVAKYGILGDGKTGVVEMAQASGLHLVPPDERNPLCTTTYGTGELMQAALAHQPETLIVTIGGSATNDGGIGMLQALGAKVLDARQKDIPFGGGSLGKIAQIDLSHIDPRLAQTNIKIACDVTNPLVGPRGASYVFGPQKGATPDMLQQLDDNLTHMANVAFQATGLSLHDVPGAGAAGGLGAALLLCGGSLVPGIDLVLDLLSFDEQVRDADYVLTGEGKIDDQTPDGKVIAGIVKRANQSGVPVIAFAGTVLPGYESLYAQGLLSANSIIPKPCALEEALAAGKEFLFQAVENIVRLLK
ncbi:glycerate kinase [Laceyella putida]|uniref:Glycerate kinase n=1 Tax=Laceyella putida TaxID=110101 RepID=A0ABW2RPG3_9BACL